MKQTRIDGVSDGAELLDLLGGRLEVVGRADTADADVVILRGTMAPGGGVPLHSHTDYECFHVLSGQLDVFVEPHGWTTVGAGRSAVIANGERHAIRNATDRPVELVVVCNNRLARFHEEAGTQGVRDQPPSPPTPEKIERLLITAGRYGYWLATPGQHEAITGRQVG